MSILNKNWQVTQSSVVKLACVIKILIPHVVSSKKNVHLNGHWAFTETKRTRNSF